MTNWTRDDVLAFSVAMKMPLYVLERAVAKKRGELLRRRQRAYDNRVRLGLACPTCGHTDGPGPSASTSGCPDCGWCY